MATDPRRLFEWAEGNLDDARKRFEEGDAEGAIEAVKDAAANCRRLRVRLAESEDSHGE